MILHPAVQSNFIRSEAVNILGIKMEKINILISGLNDSLFNVESCMTTCLLNLTDDFKCSVDLLIVPKITGISFSRTFLHILLGAELFFYFLKEGKIC